MAKESVQTKALLLLDTEGKPAGFLAGDYGGTASLAFISAGKDSAALVDIGLDRESGDPYLIMHDKGGGASVTITFNRGLVSMELRNADGRELTLTPS